jgi:hypothetical protein
VQDFRGGAVDSVKEGMWAYLPKILLSESDLGMDLPEAVESMIRS